MYNSQQDLKWLESRSATSEKGRGLNWLKTRLSGFSSSIAACDSAHRWDWAFELLQIAKQGLRIDVSLFNAALSACESASAWQMVFEVWSSLKLSLRACCLLFSLRMARLLGSCRESWPDALEAHSALQRQRMRPDVVSHTALLAACERGLRWSFTLWQLEQDGLSLNVQAFTAAAAACQSAGRLGFALAIIDKIQDQALMPDAAVFSTALLACERLGSFEKAEAILEESARQRLAARLFLTATSANLLFRVLRQWRFGVTMNDEDLHSEDDDEDGEDDEDDEDGDSAAFLGRSSDALAKSLLDTQVSNELNLLKSEVKRLRSKVQSLQREKDDMVDNFRSTTQILLNRIKELEAGDGPSRPQTAAVIDRIEARPPRPASRGVLARPEVMSLEKDFSGGDSACGNCGRDIPKNNLVSHSVFCYRNNYRCPACGDVIAIRDKESHMDQWTDAARLMDAIWRSDSDMIQSMAAHGMDFTTAVHPETQDTVLHASAGLGDVELISFFMGYGVEVDPVNGQNSTPLHIASEGTQIPAMKLLVELGADLNVRNGAGETPLILVCRRGHAEAAQAFRMNADSFFSLNGDMSQTKSPDNSAVQSYLRAAAPAADPGKGGTAGSCVRKWRRETA
eukprot:s526_g1.t2